MCLFAHLVLEIFTCLSKERGLLSYDMQYTVGLRVQFILILHGGVVLARRRGLFLHCRPTMWRRLISQAGVPAKGEGEGGLPPYNIGLQCVSG